jgi:two-component system, LytTR family, response regulator
MRALLVDDERLARLELRRLLERHPTVEIIGEAASIAEAESQILALRPSLIFLDIEMPGGNSFELLDRLDLAELSPVPTIIFTTAFDRYALKAFEVQALDYLLKPIDPRRLDEALARIRKQTIDAALDAGKASIESLSTQPFLQQFFVRDGELCWMVKAEYLRLIESEGNYVRLLFGPNRPLILRSLQSLQQRLDPAVFFRANRTQIVNLKWVDQVELNPDGSLTVILRDGHRVEFSRRQSQIFRDRMTL